MSREIRTIARKEFLGFFATPAAFLFLAAFLAVTLFTFFWVDAFFARNLADVRPLFQWMPVLLIFLVAALTMRSWAEERRSGALELLLTAPTSATDLVLGKFLGAIYLVAIALALTIPLPLTISILGPLDWGPVIGGYVAAMALGAAYVAIGLWMSSRTDNQIVSLILTVLVAGLFFVVGTAPLTSLLGRQWADVLRSLGTGAHFDAITRGVLDVRDIVYYVSLTVTFLILNRVSIERLRWAGNTSRAHGRWTWIAALVAANALGANLWLHFLPGIRIDLTAGRIYTLSDATRGYLKELHEPLLIRGYFSANTHPLLAPLVPQLRDLLAEYAVVGGNKLRVEFVDPHDDPAIEQEAASRFGIRPVPFQTSTKYQAAIVNSYFDILVSYGDQYQMLSFRDLIDVKQRSESDFEIALKNPEYDITRAIRKVIDSYQGGDSPFASLVRPLVFTGYVSADKDLPGVLEQARDALGKALDQMHAKAGDKLQVHFVDPASDPAVAKQLNDEGYRPLVAGLLDRRQYWFHLALSDGRQTEPVTMPQTFDVEAFKRTLDAAVRRFAPGSVKTVAVYTPPAPPAMGMGMNPDSMGQRFTLLKDSLGNSVRWVDATLRDGQVPASADLLIVLDPQNFDEKQQFAVDQFLMQGGTVLISTAHTDVSIGQSINGKPVTSGLEDWLKASGLELGNGFVLDPRSGSLPIPVERQVGGGFTVREIQLVPYPYIVEARGESLDPASPITANLGQLELPWVEPILVDATKNKDRKLTVLVSSSRDSWISEATDLLPDYGRFRDLGFAPGDKRAASDLAVMVEGRFDSTFAGKDSPLLQDVPPAPKPGQKLPAPPASSATASRVIDHSPPSARLILVGSSAVFGDVATELISQVNGSRDTKPAEFAQNIIDWSLEDQSLLAIRSRGRFARTLVPMSRGAQMVWEYFNYGLAALGVGMVAVLVRRRRRSALRRYAQILQGA
jgi:ABC-2 type transport system permease protein